MKVAWIYAGQGSQRAGMGADFYEKNPTFANVVDRAEAVFSEIASADASYGENRSLKKLMFGEDAELLGQTRYTQPAMAAFGAGVCAVLKEKGFQPDAVAGLSLGEYGALHAAGVFDVEALIRLLAFRGKAMEEAAAGKVCSMSAVLGGEREALVAAVAEAAKLGVVEISNYNATGQTVIAGEEVAVAKAEELVKESGAKRCMRLAVSGPFHTSFMKPAGDALKKVFAEMTFGTPQVPVIFNTTARPLEDGQTIPALLVKQVQSSVYMEDTLLYLQAQGFTHIVEIGPGKVIAGFAKRTVKGMQTVSIDKVDDLDKMVNIIGESK